MDGGRVIPSRGPALLPQLASVNRVVLDLFKLYQPAFSVKRLGTGLDLDPNLPLTWADRSQLELGLGNLVSNAVKHTRRGGLIVCRTALDGSWVKLTLGDNGPGIDAQQASRLFQPHRNGDGPERRGGMDLYLSQTIITAHGGEIAVDHAQGSGAWFVVRLPAIALENARLVQQLEDANRRRADLLSSLSYELRTPLNVVMGYLDLLLDGAFGILNGEQVDTVRRMERGALDLLGLIDGTIDMSCLDAGRLPLELRDLHLPDLIRRFCQLTTEVLGCDFSHTFLWQRSSDVYVPVAGYGDTLEQWEWVRTLRVPAAHVMRLLTRRDREDDVVTAEPPDWLPAGLSQRYGMPRVLVVALRRGGETLGFLTAGDRNRSRVFTGDQARLAQGIADLAGLALENARLVDELERTKRLKADFVTNMSHQFRIPLNVIIGYNDLLLDGEFGPLPPEQTNVFRRVRKSSLELLDAIHNILDSSRVEPAVA
jgi:signal transduction histidine kinase